MNSFEVRRHNSPLNTLLPLLALAVMLARSTFGQGSLTPPGPPSPTMKTLDQVEPRTPITSLPFTISNPGSYYVVSNMVAPVSTIGLTIAADRVTVDLQGFTLRCSGGISIDGILVSGAHSQIVVRNGNLLNWSGTVVNGTNATQSEFEDLRMEGGNYNGIVTGDNCTVSRCLGHGVYGGSSIAAAVSVGKGSRVQDCVARACTLGVYAGEGTFISGCVIDSCFGGGIEAGASCRVDNCIVRSNAITVGPSGFGLFLGSHGRATGCNISWNGNSPLQMAVQTLNECTLTACTVDSNSGTGISTGGSVSIVDCTVVGNGTNGIVLTGDSGVIHHSIISSNSGAGLITGPNAVVSDCHALGNSLQGIVAGTNVVIKGCLIANNTSDGVAAAEALVVRDSQFLSNHGYGIIVTNSATVEISQARSNSATGIAIAGTGRVLNTQAEGNATGFSLGLNSTIQGSQALANNAYGILTGAGAQILDCESSLNAFRGIHVGNGSRVSRCVANGNGLSGIYVFLPGCQVTENSCNNNNSTASASEAGIYIDDSNNRVDGNHLNANGYAGVSISPSYNNNVVVRNTVMGNGANNYLVPGSGNDVGPIGTTATASPWANISH